MVNKWINALSYAVLPGYCLLCLDKTFLPADLCQACREDLPLLRQRCSQCALPINSGTLCGHCLKKAPPFQQSLASWEYAFPIDSLISQFKYHGHQLYGHLLASLWAEQHALNLDRPDFLLPVPMHWRKRLQRRFNQTDVLANDWGRHFRIPLLKARRMTPGLAQQGLNAAARRRNLQHAFALSNRARQQVCGKHIAIVDDVMTTGATATSLAGILRDAGAKKVSVWCLARTP